MSDIEKTVDRMEPEQAIFEIGAVLKKLFPLLSEETRADFMFRLVGDSTDDKVSSLVHR